MKDKTADIEKLGELLNHISLNENIVPLEERSSKVKCSNLIFDVILNDEADSDSTDEDDDNNNNNTSFDGLKSLRSSKASGSDTEPEVLRKRGPQTRGRTPWHISTPYNGQRTVSTHHNGGSIDKHCTLKRQFFSGGEVSFGESLPPMGAIPQVLEPLIPDLSQLLDEKLLEGNVKRNNAEQFPLDCNDTFKFILAGEEEALPDLGISDGFLGMLDPENDFPQTADTTFQTVDSSLEDQFSLQGPDILGMLDPQNDFPQTADTTLQTVDSSLEDKFSLPSPDIGYISGSPESISSYPESPASFILSVGSPISCGSPSSSSCSSSQAGPTKKKRNPYFEGLDEKYCDRCRRAILKKALEKNGLNQKDSKNRTLLHLTIEQKDEVYAVVMLNMLQKSFQNETGKLTIPNFSDLPSFLNQEDDYGRTPLLLACIYNLPRVLEYLLDCGASPALKEKFLFGSALHYVCERGDRFQRVTEILCTKAPGFINMTNNRRETPLHIAVGYHGLSHQDGSTGAQEVVDNRSLICLLLSKNAKLSVQDELGRTPLHWMIITRNLDLLETFYSQACDWRPAVNMQNMDGRTILHGAAQLTNLDLEKQKDLVQKLVVYYASPQIQDKLGKYPKDLVPDGRKAYLNVLNGHFCENRGWQADLVL